MTEPVKIDAVIAETFGQERDATCSCGAAFRQIWYGKRWIPIACSRCRGLAEDERTLSTVAATAAVRLAALEVPALYREVDLASFELHGSAEQRDRQSRILQFARRYLGRWPDVEAVIVFRGAPGSGKGHIVWSLAKALVTELGATAYVCKLPDVIRDLREAWRNDDGPSERERLARYRTPDLLAIDEVSRHAFYGEPRQHLYDLIDHRVERGKPTLLTTNEDSAGLADLLGPALVSRAAGSGIWEFGAADWRLRPRAHG